MMHKWVSSASGYDCINCGMIVEPQPFDDGYYPLQCDPPEREDSHRHYIVPAIRGAECYYCSETWGAGLR